MKTYSVGLQASVSSGSYNKNQTSALGQAFQKTINSQSVIGPALTGFIDTQTVAATAPGLIYYVPTANILFVAAASATSVMTILAYNFNNTTGANSYIGKIFLNFANSAATTNTIKGFAAYTDGTNVRIMIQATGSVAVNSGIYLAYCPLSSFTAGGTNLYPASGSGQNAIYLLQASDYVGVNAVTGFANTGWGFDYPYMSSNSAVNTKLYTVTNTLAAPNVQSWDLSVTPTVADISLNNVKSLTGGYAIATYGQPTLAYFNMPSWLFYQGAAGADPVVLMQGTVATPTGFTAWTAGSLQTTSNVYFTRDVYQTYTFTCSSLASGITAAATYQVTGVASSVITLTANITYGSGVTSIILSTPNYAQVPASGTLSLISGTGPSTITYSAAASNGVYFNLATTTGGAAVAATSTNNGFSMMRAFGTSNNQYLGRTPIAGLLPALAGSIITSNGVCYAKPASTPQNTALQGQDCLSFPSTTNLYLGKLSDLFYTVTGASTTFNSTTVSTTQTSGLAAGMAVVGPGIQPGATIASVNPGVSITLSSVAYLTGTANLTIGTNNWTSLTGSNILGTGIDYVAPTLTTSRYGAQGNTYDIDRFVYNAFTSAFFFKPLQNNNITVSFGGLVDNYYETTNPTTIQFGVTALAGMECRAGWMFISGTSTGQRGVQYADVGGDTTWGATAVISTIQYVPPGTIFKNVYDIEQLFDYTDSVNFWIRSASTASDPTFNSANIPTYTNLNGWTSIKTAQDLSSTSIGPYFQLCATYSILTFTAQTPAQIQDIYYTVALPGEASANWAASSDNTTQSGTSPMYVAWRLQTAYSTSVPTLYVRGYDDSGNLVASFNTVTNASSFSYTTNNGTSWNSLGTIPNTALTTEVRVNVATPPATNRINWSIAES